MELVKPYAEFVTGLDPFTKIEKIGRTCYKSEDKITSTSKFNFVKSLIARNHFAMLEHARFLFTVITDNKDSVIAVSNVPGVVVTQQGNYTRYFINVSMSHLYNPEWTNSTLWTKYPAGFFAIFKNMIETKTHTIFRDEMAIIYHPNIREVMSDPDYSKYASHHVFLTAHFVCDRGVSHEIVRHRCSFGQESTRYCNYTKEKIGGGNVKFIEPRDYDKWSSDLKNAFEKSCKDSEESYNFMISVGATPQQARAVLSTALKTELYMTAPLYQWEHFVQLRSRGTTGAPHPDMETVASLLDKQILNTVNREWLTKI